MRAALFTLLALLVTADARKCKAKTRTTVPTTTGDATTIAVPTVTAPAFVHQPSSAPSASESSSVHSDSAATPSDHAASPSPSEPASASDPAASPSAPSSNSEPSPSPSNSEPSPSPSNSEPSPSPSHSEPSSAPSPTPSPSAEGPADPTGAVPGSDPVASAILGAHNTIRRRYGAPAIAWNDELSAIAVEQAQACNFENQFPAKRQDYTDVIWNNGDGDFANSVTQAGWQGENYVWPEDGKDKTYQEATSQWTQIVWKATTDVGCGWHKCGDGSESPSLNGQYKFVCLYNTHQTYVGSPDAFNENIPNKP
ncbi:hypothetical protein CspeluHIS016_0501060 [Cutaneotrichosporon spelunceum]|uniref:SCP domain-containing protein n=1 Tax=Cutaneotrichosporon spelunceum TaxID=1672016 RepID=A0AAD3YDM1_9TREE|nr:hypothetical protein CspeluHIS016_0501060 [Cutaneotrichosporon spelunceum]